MSITSVAAVDVLLFFVIRAALYAAGPSESVTRSREYVAGLRSQRAAVKSNTLILRPTLLLWSDRKTHACLPHTLDTRLNLKTPTKTHSTNPPSPSHPSQTKVFIF
jgi:hypothetical protein